MADNSHDMNAPAGSSRRQTDRTQSTEDTNNSSQTYTRTPGFATTRGQSFEMKIAALLFLRGLNSGQVFELGTNVEAARDMDDIIFRFKTKDEPDVWITCFIQVKHKENKKKALFRNMLIGEKGDFSLPKYLKSYIKIKETMTKGNTLSLLDGKVENSWFIVFSNAKANDDLGEGKDCLPERMQEKFVWTNQGKIFSFKDANEFFKTDLEEGGKFLSQLKFFCGQANEQGLDALITHELLNCKAISNRTIDVPTLSRIFMADIKEWCEASNGTVLKNDSKLLEAANEKTLLEVCSMCEGKSYQLPERIQFNEAAISELRETLGRHNFIHFVPSESSFKLSYTKLIQALKDSTYCFFGIGSMIPYQQHVLKEWNTSRNTGKTLIIVFSEPDQVDDKKAKNFFNDVCKKLNTNSKARIVLLAEKCNKLVNQIGRLNEHFTIYEGNFEASQLEESSLTFISCNMSFKLQGFWTKLGNFPDTPNQSVSKNLNDATLKLDGCLLVDIIDRGSRFSVGAQLPESIKYYVTRTMDQTVVLKSQIFLSETTSENISVRQATMKYVQSIFAKSVQRKELLTTYSRSVLIKDSSVFIGEEFMLGRFACNFIGFQSQYDKDIPIPALRVRMVNATVNNQKTYFKSFLFIFRHCVESQETVLLDFHETKHFLRLESEGKMLIWTNSATGTNIDEIKRHVDENQVVPTVDPDTATCVNDRRVVLLCAEPGIGKSTLMTRMSKKTKEAHTNFWIILLSLNDQTHLFAKKMHENVLEFLLEAGGIKNESEVSLFKIALFITGNVVVLLDGFDEIAPKYIDECCVLLTNLINTKAHKIWITSRNSMKGVLENHLSTLAANLRKFNEIDQRRFLKQYWAEKSTMSESGLDAFISNLIDITSQTIRDQEKDFMGIPLQTQIMAEVFEDCVKCPENEANKLPQKLDLLDLLGKFVDKKLTLLYQARFKLNPDDTAYQQIVTKMDTKPLYDGHKQASIILLLNDEDLKELKLTTIVQDSEAFFEDIKSSEEKTGIIDGVLNDKPRFVHRVFAEFFLAQWFSEHLKENSTFLKNKLYSPEYGVILNFFDRILAKKYCLHTAVLDANLVEVRRLLEKGEEVNVVDEGGRTALHLAATLGSSKNKTLSDGNMKILKLIMEKSPNNIYLEDTILLGTPLRYADDAQWWPAVNLLMADKGYPNGFEEYLVKTKSKMGDAEILMAIVAMDLVELLNFCLGRKFVFDFDTYLALAGENGSHRVAEILIGLGADFSCDDCDERE